MGSRLAAAVLDTLLIWMGALFLVFLNASLIGEGASEASGWAAAFLILLLFLLFWGYFALFEAVNGGRTPGKQALGIRVVMDTGRPITGAAAVVRNLVRLLDCYFPLLPALPALLMMFLQKSNKRLGDIAAGTIVVRDRPTGWSLAASPSVREAVEQLRQAFIAKHGREPGADDLLFPDLPHPEHLEARMVEEMQPMMHASQRGDAACRDRQLVGRLRRRSSPGLQ